MSDSPPEPVFFVDRSLGSFDIPMGISGLGHLVIRLEDCFPPNTPDTIWLPRAGAEGWIVLTKDSSIQKNPAELEAARAARVALFVFVSSNLGGEKMLAAIKSAIPRILRLVQTHTRPLIAWISPSGAVTVKEGQRRGGVRK